MRKYTSSSARILSEEVWLRYLESGAHTGPWPHSCLLLLLLRARSSSLLQLTYLPAADAAGLLKAQSHLSWTLGSWTQRVLVPATTAAQG